MTKTTLVFLVCFILFPLTALAQPRELTATELARSAMVWQPTHVSPRTIRSIAHEVMVNCDRARGALGENCPSLMMALGWRESSWRPSVVGKRPWRAVGVFQVHGAALDTYTREEAHNVRINTMLAVRWLTISSRECGGDMRQTLQMYGTGSCIDETRRYYKPRRLIRWASDLQDIINSHLR